ncbi:MAG: copper chaperone PCu(A)C [Gallionella sp.]|nr:copper chaperone PCu(A)C [Gallionella sp.]
MNYSFRFGIACLSILFSGLVHATNVQVDNAWAKATLPGQSTGLVNLTLTSKPTATLIGATSPACKSVELHSMTHDNGMMKMREVKAIKLPAGEPIDLEKAGFHLMLIGLKSALKEGENVPLTLHIKQANQRVVKVKASAIIKPVMATPPTSKEDTHEHHH